MKLVRNQNPRRAEQDPKRTTEARRLHQPQRSGSPLFEDFKDPAIDSSYEAPKRIFECEAAVKVIFRLSAAEPAKKFLRRRHAKARLTGAPFCWPRLTRKHLRIAPSILPEDSQPAIMQGAELP
jgi:hypothetical protein